MEARNQTVLQSLSDALKPEDARRSIADARLGLGYTAVVLDDGRMGVAYTVHNDQGGCCSFLQEAGSLKGRSLDEVIHHALDGLPLWRSIAVAGINALAPSGDFQESEGNIVDLLHLGKNDRLGMVGYFKPLLAVENEVKELVILENRPMDDARVHPAHQAPLLLPTCSVVIITAVTVVNDTFNTVITSCTKAREIALLGPSTPMFPAVFAPYGLTLLGGVRVVDAPGLLRIISEGGGARQFGRTVRKVNARLPRKPCACSAGQGFQCLPGDLHS